jgi:hypothetical protein
VHYWRRRQDELNYFMIDMWGAALRVCPKWRGYWPGGDTMVEWLYNYRPEIARAIEREHKLYADAAAAEVTNMPTGAAATTSYGDGPGGMPE